MSTYFITGGEGFIGYHISKQLRDEGHEVITYDANKHYLSIKDSRWTEFHSTRVNELNDIGVERIKGDVNNRGLLTHSLRKHNPDYIIHLAALPIARVCNEDPEQASTDILDTILTLMDVLRHSAIDLKRITYTSSSMVYGDFNRDKSGDIIPATEDQECDPLGVYGALKLSGEHIVKAYSRRYDIPYTIIRPSAVYGPTDSNRRVTEIFLTNAMKGKDLRLDDGGWHELDFTYVKDTAEGFILATNDNNGINETFNITRGQGRMIRELAEVVRSTVGEDVGTYEYEQDVYRPNRGTLDISKAKELLGYDPEYSLEEGIRLYHEFLGEVIL